ncbi:MAG: MotE family protein [Butyrivibrio sp.]
MAENEDLKVSKDYDDIDDGEGRKGRKGKMMTSLIAVFIVLIWIAIFALLIKLDVGGFGSSVMYPVLKDVPVLNKILPSNAGDEVISNSGDTYTTLQEAINRINELENELGTYKTNLDDSAEQIRTLTAERDRLKSYEDNQVYFEQLKKKFDQEVVYTDNAPDIQEYKEWYEQMDPDNAAEIYRQVIEQQQMDQVIEDLAKTYSSMKPAEAANILEGMTGDLEKVANILTCMKAADSGAILAAMDSTIAAKLTLLIYPTDGYNNNPNANNSSSTGN